MEENKILERHTPGCVSLGIKLKRVVWNVTAALLFRPFITPVFRKWRLLLLRMFGAEVEWDANVYASVKVWAPWMLKMGHRACLGPAVICYNQDLVVLEDDVIVSQYSYLCTAGHDIDHANTADSGLVTSPIVLAVWRGSVVVRLSTWEWRLVRMPWLAPWLQYIRMLNLGLS